MLNTRELVGGQRIKGRNFLDQGLPYSTLRGFSGSSSSRSVLHSGQTSGQRCMVPKPGPAYSHLTCIGLFSWQLFALQTNSKCTNPFAASDTFVAPFATHRPFRSRAGSPTQIGQEAGDLRASGSPLSSEVTERRHIRTGRADSVRGPARLRSPGPAEPRQPPATPLPVKTGHRGQ